METSGRLYLKTLDFAGKTGCWKNKQRRFGCGICENQLAWASPNPRIFVNLGKLLIIIVQITITWSVQDMPPSRVGVQG